MDSLIPRLKESSTNGLVADAIVCIVSDSLGFPGLLDEDLQMGDLLSGEPLESVVRLVRDVRGMPPYCAMNDGRKWSSAPIVLIVPELDRYAISEPLEATVITMHRQPDSGLEQIRAVISKYRSQLFDELDNLGLLVTYRSGRYRVSPALTVSDRAVEGHFYYGPADTRQGARGKYFTVDRDEYGIQYEIEQFEALINDPEVTEYHLQKFFEENPHFLVTTRLMQALPHVRLEAETGKILIPDFVLKPIVAVQRDSNWQVVDLKHPQAKLLAGPSDHRRFSQEVMQAINQVRDYKDHFENPANTSRVASVLGHRLRHPQLGVLIGRMPASAEVELLEKAQAREPEVRIVTYDEILETQKQLLQ